MRDATAVVHDWGGPIGLRLAVEHPDRFSRMVIMETGPFTGHQRMSDAWLKFRDFVRDNADVPVGMLVRGGCKNDPGDEVIAAYEAPYPDAPSRRPAPRAFPLILPTEPDAPGAAEGKAVADALRDRRAADAGPLGRLRLDPALLRRRAGLRAAQLPAAAGDRERLPLPAGGRRAGDRPDHRRVARLTASLQLLARVVGEQADAARRALVLDPGDRARPVGARRRAGVVEGVGEDPAAGVVEAAAAGQPPVGLALVGAGAVGVAGDRVGGVDLAGGAPSRGGGDSAAGDRGGGEVGVEVGAEEAVEQPDAGRDAGVDGGLDGGLAGASAAAVAAGDRAPGVLGGTGRGEGDAGLGEAEEEAVERAQDALVVGRCGGIGWASGGAHHRRRGDALHPRQAHMAVHVVAVGGVDVIAQPDAGVGDAELGVAEPGGRSAWPARRQAGRGARGRARHRPARPLRAAAQRGGGRGCRGRARPGDPPSPRRAPRRRARTISSTWASGSSRSSSTSPSRTRRSAPRDLVEQDAADRRVASQVLAGGAAEVQVGDDRGAHPGPN